MPSSEEVKINRFETSRHNNGDSLSGWGFTLIPDLNEMAEKVKVSPGYKVSKLVNTGSKHKKTNGLWRDIVLKTVLRSVKWYHTKRIQERVGHDALIH